MSDKTTSLPSQFDANDVPPQQAMEAFPGGWYPAEISDGEVCPTKDQTGTRVELEFMILDGPYKNRKVFDGLNILNKSAAAQEIGQQQLSALCHATGVFRIQDIQELFHKPFNLKVGYEAARKTEEGKSYEARNTFKGAKALEAGSGATPAPAAQAASNAPSWAKAKPNTPAPAAQAAQPAPEKPKVNVPTTPPFAAKKPAAPAKVERKFYMFFAEDNMPLLTESQVVENFAQGAPKDTPLLSEEDSNEGKEWADAEAYGVATEKEQPAPAAPAAPAKPKPAASKAAVAPWQRK